jgi:VCBS repeat-containing protein
VGRAITSPGAARGRLARLAVAGALALVFGGFVSPQFVMRVLANDCNGVSFATNDNVATNEDTDLSIPAFANDLCVDGVTGVAVQIVSGPSHGKIKSISFAQDSLYYVPDPDYAGPDSFLYRFWSTQYPDWSTGTVSITVNPVNDPPAIFWAIKSDCQYGLSITVAEDSGPYSHDCFFGLTPGGGADEASQIVTVLTFGYDASLFSVAPHFENTSVLAFTPAPNANGSTTISYMAKDNGGTANGGQDLGPLYTASVTITPVNDAPVARADSYTVQPSTTKNVPAPGVLANDSDVDSPVLSAHVAAMPGHGTLTLLADGSFSYHPDAGFSGTDTFTYTASDGSLSSAATKVTLTVSATATAPPATSASGSGTPPTTPAATAETPSGDIAGGGPSAAGATPNDAATPPAVLSSAGGGSLDGSPAGTAGGTDLTPIVLAIVIAGLLIGLGLIAGAVILRRRTGGTP